MEKEMEKIKEMSRKRLLIMYLSDCLKIIEKHIGMCENETFKHVPEKEVRETRKKMAMKLVVFVKEMRSRVLDGGEEISFNLIEEGTNKLINEITEEFSKLLHQ